MSKYFNIPFANSGDKSVVPDASQPSGAVSYSEGWTLDYERDQETDPAAKDVDRESTNQVLFDVTEAMKEVQDFSALPYRTDANYPINARVVGSDSQYYRALQPNGSNTTIVNPVGDTTGTWEVIYTNYSDMKAGRRNAITDGRFDYWYEGTSQTSGGYGSDTMWSNDNVGSTKTHTRQALVAGVDLPTVDNPTSKYFSRTVVSSIAGSPNYVLKKQSIENVRSYAGKSVTFSFYARADSAKNISIELAQNFGSGGDTSVTGIGTQTIGLTTEWGRYSATIEIPTIAGKTIDDNDSKLDVFFWFDSGSNFDARTDNLGQQSGTFDIACVQLEEGSQMTKFEELPKWQAQSVVDRYYQTHNTLYPYLVIDDLTERRFVVPRREVMRAIPAETATLLNTGVLSFLSNDKEIYADVTGASTNLGSALIDYIADARL